VVPQIAQYVDDPSTSNREAIHTLLSRLEQEQNQYKHGQWGAVRIIHSKELVTVETALPLLDFSVPQPRTLEYGCGTGPGACFLAARGFQVDGIDISPIAIGMAKEFAAQRGLTINYAVSDICKLPPLDSIYDLIVDSFCLQCIVTNSDRSNVFSAVRSRLKPQGYYLKCALL
jgi:SAM-dependent methyltransferase